MNVILKSIQDEIGSQCKSANAGVMCSYFSVPVKNLGSSVLHHLEYVKAALSLIDNQLDQLDWSTKCHIMVKNCCMYSVVLFHTTNSPKPKET